jgi:transposase-like protein
MGGRFAMVKSTPHYSKEFKLRICREIESGSTVAEVSRKNHVHPTLVYGWAKKYREDPQTAFASGGGRKTAETSTPSPESRIEELERLVGQLTLENAFLKKTLRTVETTFGRVPPKSGTR